MSCWIKKKEEELGKCFLGNFWHLFAFIWWSRMKTNAKGSRDGKRRPGADQKSCSFSTFRHARSKAAGKWETRDFSSDRMNEWGHSEAVTSEEEEGKERGVATAPCASWLARASSIAVVDFGTNLATAPTHCISRERHYPQSPGPPSPHGGTRNTTNTLTPFLLRWSDGGSCRWGGSHRCSEKGGGTTNNSKIDTIPLTETHISCAESGCSCCHRWCRKQRRDGDVSRQTFSFSDQRGLWCSWSHLAQSRRDCLSEAACRTAVFITF